MEAAWLMSMHLYRILLLLGLSGGVLPQQQQPIQRSTEEDAADYYCWSTTPGLTCGVQPQQQLLAALQEHASSLVSRYASLCVALCRGLS
jgi:hypothetical protein